MAGHDHDDHGHTPAAWTGVIIAFLGFGAAGAFMIAADPVPFWASMGVILLAPVVGGVMRLMGLGKKEEPVISAARAEATPAQTGEAAAPVTTGVPGEEAHASA